MTSPGSANACDTILLLAKHLHSTFPKYETQFSWDYEDEFLRQEYIEDAEEILDLLKG